MIGDFLISFKKNHFFSLREIKYNPSSSITDASTKIFGIEENCMVNSNVRKQIKFLTIFSCLFTLCFFSFAKPAPKAVKEEEGFYYGYGKGSSKDEAIFAAKVDLIETALTAKVREENPKKPRVKISDESAKNRLANLKPYTQDKKGLNVVYRIKLADWDKAEKAFTDELRASITPRYEALRSKNPAERINESMALLTMLAENGVTDLLTVKENEQELFSGKIESECEELVKNLQIEILEKDGFISSDKKIPVSVKDKSGKAVAGLNLKIYWEISELLASAKDTEEVVTSVKTNGKGNAEVEYPTAEAYRNKPVTLTVSTAFTLSEQATKAMKKFDGISAVDAHFVHNEDFGNAHKFIDVEAGEFNAGAVPQDSRAGQKEASRKASTEAYSIAEFPVTNADFAAFLHATRAETIPEYFDNPAYNQDAQPVVGVSFSDAEAYAAWLSEQTGAKYRLPSEEEWEKAARAGSENIYPWGDKAPNKEKCANYKGNKVFKSTSPVGSFENGKNAWGIADMAGNVWEWTTSTREEEPKEETSARVVKGGSWMDGPTDLRISNFRIVDSDKNGVDIGFRLVREITK